MSKETKNQRKPPSVVSLPVVHPHAAGIDVSATMHVVAIPPDRPGETVKQFDAFTEDLEALAQWLVANDITTVAMESTGIYWKQLFLVLQQHGLEVALVHARQVKNVTGRKTDVSDAQWIQKLHSCGLLNSCFLPDDATERLRSLVRHRKSLVEDSSKYVLRMQKALEMMNIKIQGVLSDIMGKTGTAIIEGILAGKREPAHFLPFIHPKVKADKETLLKSLTGNWREDQLFLLEENYRMHQHVEKHITICEQKIETFLQKQLPDDDPLPLVTAPATCTPKKKKKKNKNEPAFDVGHYLYQIHRVDVTEIYGISNSSALEILSETGADLSKWETEDHFVSWLNLCPNNKITGGKMISSKVMKKKAGIATQAFRTAANTLQRSDHWLGDYFRRMKAKGGNKYAIVATARKLAIIYYKMVRDKVPFTPMDKHLYRQQYKSAKIAYYEKQLIKLKAVA